MIRLFWWLAYAGAVSTFKLTKGPLCGKEASSNLIHRNPWLVYLEYYRGDHKIDIRCAATLVDHRHLITAAHCIKTPKFSRLVARLGEYDLTREDDCVSGICADPVVKIDIEEAIIHPDYDERSHDIAVLRLVEDAPYTDFIRPICLPSGNLYQNTIFTATGWGEIPLSGYYSTTKKIILLPLWERNACEDSYEHSTVPNDVICAGGQEGNDTCRGDSGGPLVWIKDSIELWGVTSAGNTHCGTKNSPGLYTNVATYIVWVSDVIAGNYWVADYLM